ncbi:hypothetical protein K456DRAFT_1178644 [Colletotrichum gloeosporioides 23]|nr:hypothetical protein K456DRAFT_1178644 [Colletotrichum gloeosporioides 23]
MAPTARHVAQQHALAVPPGELRGPKKVGICHNGSQQLFFDFKHEFPLFDAYSGNFEWLAFAGHNDTSFGSIDIEQVLFLSVRQIHPQTVDVLLLSAMTAVITIQTLLIAVYPFCPRFLTNKIKGIRVRKPAPASASACMAKCRPPVSAVSRAQSKFLAPTWIQILVIFPHYKLIGKQTPSRGSVSSRASVGNSRKATAQSRGGTQKRVRQTRSRYHPIPEGGETASRESNNPGKGKEDARRFACPFAKRNALHHLGCLFRDQVDPRYVKIHLGRDHRAPIHCPTCYEIFDFQENLNNHIIARQCDGDEGSESPYIEEFVSEDQMTGLAAIRGGGSNEDRWFRIWDVLFPGEERPSDPYSHPNPMLIVYEAVLRTLEPALQRLPAEQSRGIRELALREAQRGPQQRIQLQAEVLLEPTPGPFVDDTPFSADDAAYPADDTPYPAEGTSYPADDTSYAPSTVAPSYSGEDITGAWEVMPSVYIQAPQGTSFQYDFTTGEAYTVAEGNGASDAYPSYVFSLPFQSMSNETGYSQNTTSNSINWSQDSVINSETANEFDSQSTSSQQYGGAPNYSGYTSIDSL